MRLRLEIGATLDRLENRTGHGMAIKQMVPRINIELEREANGLGDHQDTVRQLRDGLMGLGELKGDKRTAKIQKLRGLVNQLPELKR